ncbi:MAG: hypothetical protein ACTHLX_03265 [Candidatus Binatia bacterium]
MVRISRWVYVVLCIVVPVLLFIASIFVIEEFRTPQEETQRNVPFALREDLLGRNQLAPWRFAPPHRSERRCVVDRA